MIVSIPLSVSLFFQEIWKHFQHKFFYQTKSRRYFLLKQHNINLYSYQTEWIGHLSRDSKFTLPSLQINGGLISRVRTVRCKTKMNNNLSIKYQKIICLFFKIYDGAYSIILGGETEKVLYKVPKYCKMNSQRDLVEKVKRCVRMSHAFVNEPGCPLTGWAYRQARRPTSQNGQKYADKISTIFYMKSSIWKFYNILYKFSIVL